MIRFIYIFHFIFLITLFANNSIFTQDELKYIKENKVIKMCNNPNWEPIEFIQDGVAQGIAIDVLKEIEIKLNIKFEYVKTNSWKESQTFLKEKKCDILPAATKTKPREQYANFTQPYLKYKLAIITKNDKPFVEHLESILDKTMSRKEGSGLTTILRKEYPNIQILETVGYEESLKKVSKGEVYYTIATLPVASHYIEKFGLYNLHIAGYTDFTFNLSIAVQKDKEILRDILDKTLSNFSSSFIQNIENDWAKISINEKNPIDYQFIIKISIIILILLIFLLYRQYELKKHHNILKQTNMKFEKMLSATMEAVLLSKDKRIIDLNQAAYSLLGATKKENLIGKNVFDFVTKESMEFVTSQSKLDETKPYEAMLKKLDGTPFPALLRGVNYSSEIENIRIITILDLTAIKQKEQLLSHSTKMAQMGEMIGNIAHQWRQPLSVITTAATGMKIKKEYNMLGEEEMFSLIDSIMTNATHLSDTIDTFRNFIKEKVELKEVIIQDRINNALNIINTRLENKYIKLINNIDYNNKMKAVIVVGELSQVIINIINNSIDILLEKDIENKWIQIDLYKENKNIVITIEDNGGGIADDILPKIFEPYFTTKHQAVGTGIGLYMSYDIIKNHMNGNLYTKNTKNGAKFFIELPLGNS